MKSCSRLMLLAVLAGVPGMAAGLDSPQRITTTVHADLRTGKLVRSVIVASKPVSVFGSSPRRVAPVVVEPRVVSNAVGAMNAVEVPQSPATGIDQAVDRIAAQHSLPPRLIHSVIQVESNYDPFAVSSKGAQGLMQLIPATARRFGVSDSFNPVENIQGGARYLKYLLNLYNGNYPLALAAYNAGEAAVARYGGVPPYAETRNYLVLVLKRLEQARIAAGRQTRPVAVRTSNAQAKPVEPVTASTLNGLADNGSADSHDPAQVNPAQVNDPSQVGPAHIQEVIQPDGTVRYVAR